MESTTPMGVEQVRAQLHAQIKHLQGTLTHEMRLSMAHRMDAVKLLWQVEQLVATAQQEVPRFIARPHAAAFDAFKAKLLAKPKRTRRSKGTAA